MCFEILLNGNSFYTKPFQYKIVKNRFKLQINLVHAFYVKRLIDIHAELVVYKVFMRSTRLDQKTLKLNAWNCNSAVS